MIVTEDGKLMLSKGQPGMFLKMTAKAGKGEALFELTNKLHYTGDPDGPVDWSSAEIRTTQIFCMPSSFTKMQIRLKSFQ